MFRLRGGHWLWVTDPHLDHLSSVKAALEFGRALRTRCPEAQGLLVTGDIGESGTVTQLLDQLVRGFGGQVLFVLGNHDYYRSSFVEVDERVRRWSEASGATWLRCASESVQPTSAVADSGLFVVGNSGWYDARYGNESTDLELTDFLAIEELFAAQDEGRNRLLEVCRRRADELAEGLFDELCRAAFAARRRGESELLCMTHIPPFAEAAWHEGRTADARWAPFFSSKATGDALLRFVEEFSEFTLHVLCGHSHGCGHCSPHERLQVWTGSARYGAPEIAGWLRSDENCLEVRLREGSTST